MHVSLSVRVQRERKRQREVGGGGGGGGEVGVGAGARAGAPQLLAGGRASPVFSTIASGSPKLAVVLSYDFFL